MLWAGFVSADNEGVLAVARAEFQQAMAALDKGDEAEFLRLERGLKDYPLAPYLRYAWLKSHLDSTPAAELSAFLQAKRELPISGRLRKAWLQALAKEQDWNTFLQAWSGRQSTRLRCHKASAELALLGGKKPSSRLLNDIEALYLVGRSQPNACDGPFAALQRYGRMDDKLRWRRISLAMGKGQVGLAKFLRRSLQAPRLQTWVDRWIAMRSEPAETLVAVTWPDGIEARTLLTYGIRRLARRNPKQAYLYWQGLQQRYAFSEDERNTLAGYIARQAAQDHLPEAGAWLAVLVQPSAKARAWAVRMALLAGDWQGVLQAYQRLSAKERGSDHWRYWQARARQALGRPGATKIFTDLASRRGYHSFLAADRIGQVYHLNDQPLQVDESLVREVAKHPGIRRARELLLLGRYWEARSEWGRALQSMDKSRLQAAARLAASWAWPDRALVTATKAGARNALALRFPLAYRDEVMAEAARHGLDPSWIFAMIRQESAFIADAGSSAGAQGLMQLMPATGKEVAKRLGMRLRHAGQLRQSGRNIRIGTAYLNRILHRKGDNLVLATAAYNAGPSRVYGWLPDEPREAALWVETIAYKETRRYVRNILAYASIYDWRRGEPIKRLAERMPVVLPADVAGQ